MFTVKGTDCKNEEADATMGDEEEFFAEAAAFLTVALYVQVATSGEVKQDGQHKGQCRLKNTPYKPKK